MTRLGSGSSCSEQRSIFTRERYIVSVDFGSCCPGLWFSLDVKELYSGQAVGWERPSFQRQCAVVRKNLLQPLSYRRYPNPTGHRARGKGLGMSGSNLGAARRLLKRAVLLRKDGGRRIKYRQSTISTSFQNAT